MLHSNQGSSEHCCGTFEKGNGARDGLCASSRSIGVSYFCQDHLSAPTAAASACPPKAAARGVERVNEIA